MHPQAGKKKSVRKLAAELLPEQITPPPESEFTLAVAGLSCLWKGVKALHVNGVITLIPAGACIPLPPSLWLNPPRFCPSVFQRQPAGWSCPLLTRV